jgi:DNA-binding protein HU-beta
MRHKKTGVIKMNKAGLTDIIAEKTGLSKKDSDRAISAFTEAVKESLLNGEKVQLMGFGSFEVKTRKARIARNPITKEIIELPEQKIPQFKAGSTLKKMISGEK